MLPAVLEGDNEGFLALDESGLLAAEGGPGFGELHASASTGSDEVGFEFCDHGTGR
jgi:hypothetical protein